MDKSYWTSLPRAGEVVGIRVFVNGPKGGNPVPLVFDAKGMTEAQMQQVAQRYGHESAFVFNSSDPRADWRIRFFVPLHEMEMCGHATVGTLWALRQWGIWTKLSAKVETLSGLVDVEWDKEFQRVWISQPAVELNTLPEQQSRTVSDILGLSHEGKQIPVINAATSRVKTLIQIASVDSLNRLTPDFSLMKEVCEDLGSTGLYPYALETTPDGALTVCARQFPKSSGYPEDAATGIAASALWGYLINSNRVSPGTPDNPVVCRIRQGDAMGCPSAIDVKPRFGSEGEILGCWLSGQAEISEL